VRRHTLQALGGLRVLANQLAEDYRLGELVRRLKMRVVLLPYELKAQHHEQSLDSLTRHELRWLRTIHVLRPHSFPFLFITLSLPLAIVGFLLTAGQPSFSTAGSALLQVTLMARLALHLVNGSPLPGAPLRDLWLLPARDLLTCWMWGRTFFTTRVTWRGSEFTVDAEGIMRKSS
jgi:ceramide glucosyltransferase